MDSGPLIGIVGIIPVLHHFGEIQDAVAAQGCIGLQGEAGQKVEGCRSLHTEAIGILYVGSEGLSYVAHRSSLHELVGVIHIIEVLFHAKPSGSIQPSGLVVEQPFRFGRGIGAVVREIVALGLTVGLCGARVCLPWSGSITYTHLGVEEIICLVNAQRLVLVCAVSLFIKLVVLPGSAIIHKAVLQVRERFPAAAETAGCLYEGAVIAFLGIGIIIDVHPVFHIGGGKTVGHISEETEVFAREALQGQAPDDIQAIFIVREVADEAGRILPEAFLSHEIGPLENGVREAELLQLVLVAEFLVIAETVCIMKGDTPA